jgi:hypothetical protein
MKSNDIFRQHTTTYKIISIVVKDETKFLYMKKKLNTEIYRINLKATQNGGTRDTTFLVLNLFLSRT